MIKIYKTKIPFIRINIKKIKSYISYIYSILHINISKNIISLKANINK